MFQLYLLASEMEMYKEKKQEKPLCNREQQEDTAQNKSNWKCVKLLTPQ